MSAADQPLIIFIAALLIVLLLVALVLLRRQRRHTNLPPSVDSAFVFADADAFQHKKLEYAIAGLIMVTSGCKTTVVDGKHRGVDIEVYRGIRKIGIVGVMRPGSEQSIQSHIRDLSQHKADMSLRTAYLVSTGDFDDKARSYAAKLGVSLIDGAALKRMRAYARQGKYTRKPAAPPEATKNNERWKPRSVQSAEADTGDTAPWLEYY